MAGHSVLHYEILERLGAGGMGVVYKARDTHLGRFAALKILPPESVADPERRRRFVQEARAASALNHPNIVTIYDIGNADGVEFIAMEYVAGRTLEELIGRKGLRLSDFFAYAVQIADALARAHAAGIVHRDLKPSNIMVDAHGLVKVLDFGLAKLVAPADSQAGLETMTLTAAAPHTEETRMVGTAGYMSPEQVEGGKLDGRSDIFSLGAVLYEMLTGQRAFQGDTRFAVLKAIVHDESKPIHEITAAAPAELERIVARCLRKDPQWRFQHMEDLKVALAEIKQESDSGKLAVRPPLGGRAARAIWPRVAAAAMAVMALAGGWLYWQSRSGAPEIRLSQLTWDSGLTAEPAISPDGKLVAYASDRGGVGNLNLWIQQVAGGDAMRLTRGEADDHEPCFSPDGTRIAFRSERAGGGVYVVPALGGEPRLIARQGRRPRFSPDGNWIVYYVSSMPSRVAGGPAHPAAVYVVPATGGTPAPVQPSFRSARDPTWSPEGKLLFAGIPASPDGPLDLWITPWTPGEPARSGPAVRTGAVELFIRQRLSPTDLGEWKRDRLVFSAVFGSSINLWEMRVSARTGRARGALRRLTSGAGTETQPSLAASGDIAFASLTTMPDLWSLPLDANRGQVTGAPQRITHDQAFEVLPSLSADGRKVVFTSGRSGSSDVWLRDLETGAQTAVTASPVPKFSAVISRDGTRVAYAVVENNKSAIYVIPAGGGVAEKVCPDCGPVSDWSADGRKLLYRFSTARPEMYTVGLLDLASGQSRELLRYRDYSLYRAHFSADDRWIAVHADNARGDARELLVFVGSGAPAESDWITLTDGSSFDDAPRWSPDGNLLYYLSDRDGFRCVWAQRLDPATRRPLGGLFPVQHFHAMRSSPINVPANALDICVTQGRLLINVGEVTGNIWLAMR